MGKSFIESAIERNKRVELNENIKFNKRNPDFPYVKAELLTSAEQKLFKFMQRWLHFGDRVEIFPKVRLGDILKVDPMIKHSSNKSYYRISSKHVDFVIADQILLDTICVVELDDLYHETPEKVKRDDFVDNCLRTAGIPIVHIGVPIKDISYNDIILIDKILAARYQSRCPGCGGVLSIAEILTSDETESNHLEYVCNNSECKCRIKI